MSPPATSERVRRLQEFISWYAGNRLDFLLVDDRRTLPPSFTPIRLFGSDALKQQVLPLLAQGIRLAGIAASEPGMGSNLGAMTTCARHTPTGDYVLDGTKKWISLGGLARHLTVFARQQDDQGRENGISAFLVDTRSDGFIVGPEALTIGMRAVPQHETHIAHTTFKAADPRTWSPSRPSGIL